MSEITISADVLPQLAVIVGLISAGVAGITFIYNKGRNKGVDSACAKRIEENIQELKDAVGIKINDSHRTHIDLYGKINDTNIRVTNIEKDVSYIKGRMDAVHPT